MNAPQQSRMHYEGKNHDKQVRLFLKKLNLPTPAERTSKEEVVAAANIKATTKTVVVATTADGGAAGTALLPLFCQPCQLTLTSQVRLFFCALFGFFPETWVFGHLA